MNNLYDLAEISELQKKQNGLIARYVIYFICFLASAIMLTVLIEDNLLLTVILAFLLLFFILFSISFWKIKYGIISSYRSFLEDLETGKQEDYVGVYVGKSTADRSDLNLDEYIFLTSGKECAFRALSESAVAFEEGKEYHLLHIGEYLYQWEILS